MKIIILNHFLISTTDIAQFYAVITYMTETE